MGPPHDVSCPPAFPISASHPSCRPPTSAAPFAFAGLCLSAWRPGCRRAGFGGMLPLPLPSLLSPPNGCRQPLGARPGPPAAPPTQPHPPVPGLPAGRAALLDMPGPEQPADPPLQVPAVGCAASAAAVAAAKLAAWHRAAAPPVKRARLTHLVPCRAAQGSAPAVPGQVAAAVGGDKVRPAGCQPLWGPRVGLGGVVPCAQGCGAARKVAASRPRLLRCDRPPTCSLPEPPPELRL